jgi:diguanylate cyclase (GGDEF)-like protein
MADPSAPLGSASSAALLRAVRRLAALAVSGDGDVRAEAGSALRHLTGATDVVWVPATGQEAPAGVDPGLLRRAVERGSPVVTEGQHAPARLLAPVAGRSSGEVVVLSATAFSEAAIEVALTLVDQAAAALSARESRAAAQRDPLTGILNHGAMHAALLEEVARAARTQTPLTCLMVDIDHFKTVNDTHGHVVGDLVLQRVAAALVDSSRPYDRVCRYGGDEFVVLLPATDMAAALVAAERIRVDVARATGEDLPLRVRLAASVGVAEWEPGEPPIALLQAADEALLDAKRVGRDSVRRAAGRFRRD